MPPSDKLSFHNHGSCWWLFGDHFVRRGNKKLSSTTLSDSKIPDWRFSVQTRMLSLSKATVFYSAMYLSDLSHDRPDGRILPSQQGGTKFLIHSCVGLTSAGLRLKKRGQGLLNKTPSEQQREWLWYLFRYQGTICEERRCGGMKGGLAPVGSDLFGLAFGLTGKQEGGVEAFWQRTIRPTI